MSKSTFTIISMSGSDYADYLTNQGIEVPSPTDHHSTAANYREFIGTPRIESSDATHADLGITKETIAACVYPNGKSPS
jgi:hypothetical protein